MLDDQQVLQPANPVESMTALSLIAYLDTAIAKHRLYALEITGSYIQIPAPCTSQHVQLNPKDSTQRESEW